MSGGKGLFRPYTPFSHSSKRFDLCYLEQEAIWSDYRGLRLPILREAVPRLLVRTEGGIFTGSLSQGSCHRKVTEGSTRNPPALCATSLREGRLFLFNKQPSTNNSLTAKVSRGAGVCFPPAPPDHLFKEKSLSGYTAGRGAPCSNELIKDFCRSTKY